MSLMRNRGIVIVDFLQSCHYFCELSYARTLHCVCAGLSRHELQRRYHTTSETIDLLSNDCAVASARKIRGTAHPQMRGPAQGIERTERPTWRRCGKPDTKDRHK